MFLHIEHNPSGEVLLSRRIAPNEILDPEALTDKALEQIYDGELERGEPNGHIPSGCGEYRTEIRIEKHNPVVIWVGFDWYPK